MAIVDVAYLFIFIDMESKEEVSISRAASVISVELVELVEAHETL